MDLGHLNPPQREAVTHGAGPLLVLAGAGSGKTRVITHRIAYLIERDVDPRHIAALTFTNKAAAEMRTRVAHLLGSRARAAALTMGTFHSLGLRMLKEERAALGYPRGFVIYDTADQMGVVREVLRRTGDGDRRFDVKAILARISLAKNGFVEPDAYEIHEGDEYDEITAQVYPQYQRALRAFAAVDFDDLIALPVLLLRKDPEVRARWQALFRHVLVDEYQDTNRAQLMLIQELVAAHGNLTVVGDDDQSIYSWRGADPHGILGFEQDFPGARVVVLDQNYRSQPIVLEAANAVIGNNKDRRGKVLWSDKPRGQPIAHVVASDPENEAKFLATEIERLVRDEQRRYADIAVLYRSNIQTRELEEALRTAQVPYVMHGGQQFFERKEVKDVIAYLRLALSERDEISFRRVVNYPSRGIGAVSLEKLGEHASLHRTTLWTAATRARDIPGLGGAPADAIGGFTALVAELRETLRSGGPVDATRRLMETIDLYGDLRAASPSMSAAQRRIDNVESFLGSLGRHADKGKGPAALSEYLRQLSLASSDDDDARDDGGDKVALTTLHGAKGLEFPIVFLIGAEEELLPHARSLMPHATDVSDLDHVADVSEERRLAYVGITRAQERLYITRCTGRRRHGKDVPRTPSRFLLEIPVELTVSQDFAARAREVVEVGELSSFFQSLAGD